MLGSLLLLKMTTTERAAQNMLRYADNITCVGNLKNILTWWNKLNTFGPKIGYFPKAKKSQPGKYETAKVYSKTKKDIFKNMISNITCEVKRHPGVIVGTKEYIKEYEIMRVNELVNELKVLSKIKLYPKAAYCTFTSGFRQKSKYII